MAIKTKVCWQFNRGFRIQRTLPSKRAARDYAARVLQLWNVRARCAPLR